MIGHSGIDTISDQMKMLHDDVKFNFKFSQCHLLDEKTTTSQEIPTTNRRKTKKKKELKQEQLTRPMDAVEKNLRDLDLYEEKLSAFCGLWEDYPHHYYRMKFRIEMGQLVGYSNIDGSKALTSYDGHIINMVIVHPKETGRSIDHYRGRLGWNEKYIIWEKEDSSRESGWRSTRRWIRIE